MTTMRNKNNGSLSSSSSSSSSSSRRRNNGTAGSGVTATPPLLHRSHHHSHHQRPQEGAGSGSKVPNSKKRILLQQQQHNYENGQNHQQQQQLDGSVNEDSLFCCSSSLRRFIGIGSSSSSSSSSKKFKSSSSSSPSSSTSSSSSSSNNLRTLLWVKWMIFVAGLYSVTTTLRLLQWTAMTEGGDTGSNNDRRSIFSMYFNDLQEGASSKSSFSSTFCSSHPKPSSLRSSSAQSIVDDPDSISLMEMTFVNHYDNGNDNNQSKNNNNQDSNNNYDNKHKKQQEKQPEQKQPYRILCTSTRRRLPWGSYKLRCQDLQVYADQCVPSNQLQITTGIPVEFLDTIWSTPPSRWSNITNGIYHQSQSSSPTSLSLSSSSSSSSSLFWNVQYDATIFVKSLSRRNHIQYGKRYIDMVDEYNWKSNDISSKVYNLIFQTPWQGLVLFPNHHSSVVEHWYNSYPHDMKLIPTTTTTQSSGDDNDKNLLVPTTNHFSMNNYNNQSSIFYNLPDGMPIIETTTTNNNNNNNPSISSSSTNTLIRFGTVWNTRRGADPTEGRCPILSSSFNTNNNNRNIHVTYDCLDLDFDITTWYPDRISSLQMDKLRYYQHQTTTKPSSTTISRILSSLFFFASSTSSSSSSSSERQQQQQPQPQQTTNEQDMIVETVASGNVLDRVMDMFRRTRDVDKRQIRRLKQHATCDMNRVLSDPTLGSGKLYYNMFQQYDVLVVPVKNHTMKLHFGNVQRAISQMRSGVPVLLEVRGKVLQDFMDKYNYTCAFTRQNDPSQQPHPQSQQLGRSGGMSSSKKRNIANQQAMYTGPTSSKFTLLQRQKQQQHHNDDDDDDEEEEPYDNLESELNEFLELLEERKRNGTALSSGVDDNNNANRQHHHPTEKNRRRLLQQQQPQPPQQQQSSDVARWKRQGMNRQRYFNNNNNKVIDTDNSDVAAGDSNGDNGENTPTLDGLNNKQQKKTKRKKRPIRPDRELWTFNQAVQKMSTDPQLRRQCQIEGLYIAQQYSPSVIGQKFLRTVGYEGDFLC